MTVLCDYTVIRESEIIIGNGSDRNDPDIFVATNGPFKGPRFSKKFNTDGRENAQALLMVNVRGLTDSNAVVMVNDKIVKSLTPCPQGNSGQTFSQHIVLQSSLLSPTGGNNRLEIMRVQEAGGSIEQFDDFAVRDIVCFFKQSA